MKKERKQIEMFEEQMFKLHQSLLEKKKRQAASLNDTITQLEAVELIINQKPPQAETTEKRK